jgi:hypothetical protein
MAISLALLTQWWLYSWFHEKKDSAWEKRMDIRSLAMFFLSEWDPFLLMFREELIPCGHLPVIFFQKKA